MDRYIHTNVQQQGAVFNQMANGYAIIVKYRARTQIILSTQAGGMGRNAAYFGCETNLPLRLRVSSK